MESVLNWSVVISIIGVLVAYAAMFGYDKLMEVIGKAGKQ